MNQYALLVMQSACHPDIPLVIFFVVVVVVVVIHCVSSSHSDIFALVGERRHRLSSHHGTVYSIFSDG